MFFFEKKRNKNGILHLFLLLVFKCLPTITFLYNISITVKHMSRMTNNLYKEKTGTGMKKKVAKKKCCIDLLHPVEKQKNKNKQPPKTNNKTPNKQKNPK